MKSNEAHNNTLRAAFERYVTLSEDVWQDIRRRWHSERHPRNHWLTRVSETECGFYLILTGVQRLYYLTPQGNEVVLGFTFAGNFSGVYDSFIRQSPSQCYLQTLSETKLLAIGWSDLDELFNRYAVMERWGRLFTQDILFGRVQREVELMTRTAEERYRDFTRRCPVPLQQIPQKHLASYLNMTPETFSRLRANGIS